MITKKSIFIVPAFKIYIIGGHFFNVILFCSGTGLGDQSFHDKSILVLKNVFKFIFDPDPKF